MSMSILSLFSHTGFAQSTDYTYYQTTTTDVDPGVAAAAFSVFLVFYVVLLVASYVITSFLLSRIFKKAGVEGWKAWVPVYNWWITYELGGQKGFWAVLLFIPIVNIVSVVFYIIAMYQIGLNLGKEGWFVLIGIFLPLVWMIWLAFDSSVWKGAAPVAAGQVPAYQPPVAPAQPAEATAPTPSVQSTGSNEQTPPTPPTTPAV